MTGGKVARAARHPAHRPIARRARQGKTDYRLRSRRSVEARTGRAAAVLAFAAAPDLPPHPLDAPPWDRRGRQPGEIFPSTRKREHPMTDDALERRHELAESLAAKGRWLRELQRRTPSDTGKPSPEAYDAAKRAAGIDPDPDERQAA